MFVIIFVRGNKLLGELSSSYSECVDVDDAGRSAAESTESEHTFLTDMTKSL